MQHNITTLAVVGLVALCAASAPQQTRDAGAQTIAATRADTAMISGTLLTDGANPQPVRRATIRLSGSDVPGSRLAVTDDAGRFSFAHLPAGSFSLSAVKASYVTVYYGAKRPGRGPAVPIALAEGQHFDVSLKMLRGAAITGVVTDENGHPASMVGVHVSGGPALSVDAPSLSAPTDDRGVYRIFGLPPGTYMVSVNNPRVAQGTSEMRSLTTEEVDWALRQAAPAGTTPAGSTSAAPPPAAGRAVGYAPVYFPGTTDASAAEKITLGPGELRDAVSFALQFVPTARVAGMVLDPNGQPAARAMVTMVAKSAIADTTDPHESLAAMEAAMGGMARPLTSNGRFSVADVAPGTYTVTVRGSVTPPASGGVTGGGQSTMTLWGEQDITVTGQDQLGVVVMLQPGMTVAGSVVFEGTSLKPPTDLTRLRVPMTSLQPSSPLLPGAPTTAVRADGTFEFASVMPGAYNIRPPAPAGWTLKAAMLKGRDLADLPLDVKPGQNLTGIVVTFTDQQTEIAGTLLDAAGKPTPEFSIVVFSTNRAFWAPASRRIKSARPASNGTYKFSGLPPGEYFISAVTDFEPNDLYDPGLLEQLQAASYKFTLGDGQKIKQDLKISGG